MKKKINLQLSETHYQPQSVETNIYSYWEANNVFQSEPNSNKPPFSIVIPPPNVTGRLHMGHALNNSVQDSLIRYKRMDGYDALWIPGTDHAGISTQSVVKKQLDAQGINYREIGREKTIEHIWRWKEKYGDQILDQIKRIGCSCDWSKTQFTMSEELSHAVKYTFKTLYDRGLIYRGKYIVNWCPVDRTALSDDEVSTKEGGEPGKLWYIKYPLAEDPTKFITIATTRPETMLGDVAVAVNPKDERYRDLIGKMLVLPITERLIPIISDDYVDREFGTGCVKITPAHDPNDFQMGLRHNLPQINIMNEDATIGDEAPQRFHGIDRFKARELIINELSDKGLVTQIEDRMTPLARAERSKEVIEYRLSTQWFLKMKPLAEKALKFNESGELKLYPERWESIYLNWLHNTRDWCISRQIWWGHQIPAWHHKTTGEILVDIKIPEEVAKNPEDWTQDPDVLDTWFSSWLWPFSTMGWGWPNSSPESFHSKYYPTSVLSTAKDIIYFWVARMAMAAAELVGKTPFNKVYLHPVICDQDGETMSKSKGNGIDPTHVIDGATSKDLEGPIYDARPNNMNILLERIKKNYPEGFKGVGADALRLTLLSLNSEAQQVQISLPKFEEIGKRMTDKLWNASRFVIAKISGSKIESSHLENLTVLEDQYIISKFHNTISEVRSNLDSFHFDRAVNSLAKFLFDELCDWYLEVIKPRFKEGSDEASRSQSISVLSFVLSNYLKLLHPIAPFITEEIWTHLLDANNNAHNDNHTLALANYPKADIKLVNLEIENYFSTIKDFSREIRSVKIKSNIPPSKNLKVYFNREFIPGFDLVNSQIKSLIQVATNSELHLRSDETRSENKLSSEIECQINEITIHVDTEGAINKEEELKRNRSLLTKLDKEIDKLKTKLTNPGFLDKAPKELVLLEKNKLSLEEEKKEKILELISQLSK